MKLGDLVRVRFRRFMPHQITGPPEWEEWWEEGGVVAAEYHTWEKIVSVLHKGEIIRKEANDVQLISRASAETKQNKPLDTGTRTCYINNRRKNEDSFTDSYRLSEFTIGGVL